MTRMSFTIQSQADRDHVADFVRTLKDGMRVEIKQAKRSDAQNAKFWAMLNEIAEQVVWHGERLTSDDWKHLFLDAYKREIRMLPAIEGKGFVPIGRSSSDLTVAEMADVITLIEMFGANHAVVFKDFNSSGPGPDSPRTDAPAVEPPQARNGTAGATYVEEASLLSQDWREVYFNALTSVDDRAASLLTRHQQAIQMLGGQPNEAELMWMRKAWRLVQARNEGALKKGEWDQRHERLMTIPLAEVMGAAA